MEVALGWQWVNPHRVWTPQTHPHDNNMTPRVSPYLVVGGGISPDPYRWGKLYSAGHPYPSKVLLLPHRKSTIHKSQATITPRTKKIDKIVA
jgi:hypothetical protein